jgi:hypothetical protein
MHATIHMHDACCSSETVVLFAVLLVTLHEVAPQEGSRLGSIGKITSHAGADVRVHQESEHRIERTVVGSLRGTGV